jgi:integrase
MPCRRSEVGGLSWSELKLEAGTWTLPAERSKNGKAHTLPLLPMALAIIKAVPRMATRDHLFGVRANGFTPWEDAKAALGARSRVTGWVLHDIRRTVATRMADLGIAPHVIEQVLNHVSGHKSGVAGIYNRSSYEREVRAALALWHDHLRSIVEGSERKIVSMPHAAS